MVKGEGAAAIVVVGELGEFWSLAEFDKRGER